jgi:cytoskeletal protein RodZ
MIRMALDNPGRRERDRFGDTMSKTASTAAPQPPRGVHEFPIGDELRGERATLGRTLLDVQRDLRIRAAYVAAIENADPSVFPNPSFVPGYVRAYARYLGREPEEVYARFCAESGFASPGAGAGGRARPAAAARASGVFRPDFPMAEPRWRGLPAPSLAALGSLVVLAGLVCGLGYGGWTVLQNIQRVQFAPVEELPVTLAETESLAPPSAPELAQPELAEPVLRELAKPVAATALAELYRRQELEVPILAPRDGPIAGINPDGAGLLARAVAPEAGPQPASAAPPPGGAEAVGTVAAAGANDPAAAAADAVAAELAAAAPAPAITIIAERAAWIRVYLADETVIFERILETGETYSPPPDLAQPLIWAGNSGSVYVRLGDTLRGPLGSGTRAVRDVVLEPAALAERFGEVEDVPEEISNALAPPMEAAAVAFP